MRFFFLSLLIVFTMVPLSAKTQETDQTGRAIYNRLGSDGSSSSPLFNSPNSYGTRGPLSLRQMLEGKTDAATGSPNSYYGGSNFRPYGIDNNNYGINISPEEIRAARAQRDFMAQQRELESMNDLQTAQTDPTNSGYYQPGGNVVPLKGIVKKKYKQRETGFEKPKKVFNSIY